MAAFRFIAWLLVSLAIALLGADAVTSLETGAPVVRSTADIMALFGADGAAIASAAPGGVAKALATMLGLPLWAITGVIGVVLTLVFRPID
ncbi:MAG: hypothetical protein AAFY22_13180 [Pseudomonadota bacterium]